MKEKIANLIDVKSIVTLTLVFTLCIIIIISFARGNIDLITLVFTLFSNVLTAVITYLFTKKNLETTKAKEVTE